AEARAELLWRFFIVFSLRWRSFQLESSSGGLYPETPKARALFIWPFKQTFLCTGAGRRVKTILLFALLRFRGSSRTGNSTPKAFGDNADGRRKVFTNRPRIAKSLAQKLYFDALFPSVPSASSAVQN